MKEHEPPNGVGEAPRPLFELGAVVGTPGALQAMAEAGRSPADILKRHHTGDWGDLCEEDVLENNLAVVRGYRVFSVYSLDSGKKIWVITEADRSATTFLLPSGAP